MKRKVIQIAESTQLVSLPRKWALKHGIKKGDEIDLEEHGKNLIITVGGSHHKIEKTEIDVKGIESYLKYLLQGMYKKGYDEVKVHFENPSLMNELQELLHKQTIGFEVVSQSKKSCVIRAVAGGFDREFDTMFRNAFRTLISIAEGVLDMIQTGNDSVARSLVYLENDNNKYASFCRRIINKNDQGNCNIMIMNYCMIEQIEQMADEYKYFCRYIESNPKPIQNIQKEVISLYKELTKFLKDVHEVFYSYDLKRAVPLFQKRKDIIRQAYLIGESAKHTCEQRMVHYAINISQKLNDLLRYKLEANL